MDDQRNTAFQSSSIQSYLRIILCLDSERIIPSEDVAGGETGQHIVASDEDIGPDDEQLSVGQQPDLLGTGQMEYNSVKASAKIRKLSRQHNLFLLPNAGVSWRCSYTAPRTHSLDDLVNPRFIEPHTSAHCGLLVHCLEWTALARERLVGVFRDVRMPSVYERVTIGIDRCILDLSGSDRSN